MTYKMIVTGYAPEAKKMAAEIEEVMCQKALEGWGGRDVLRDQFLQGDFGIPCTIENSLPKGGRYEKR